MSRRTPLERLEDMADARYGRGSAISVDREKGEVVVRVWDARGAEVAKVASPTRTRTQLCGDLIAVLETQAAARPSARWSDG